MYSFDSVTDCNRAHMMCECEMDSVAAGSDTFVLAMLNNTILVLWFGTVI